jgi:hypothetical protein
MRSVLGNRMSVGVLIGFQTIGATERKSALIHRLFTGFATGNTMAYA